MSSDSASPAPSSTDQSNAVQQLEEQNDRQDAQIEEINQATGVEKALAQLNPFSPNGFVARINRKNRDDMIEAVAQGGTPIFDERKQIQGVLSNSAGLFGINQPSYVGNPDFNPNASFGQTMNDPQTPDRLSIANTPDELDAYYGRGQFDPSRTGGRDDNMPMSDLDQARSRRATALANKQSELTNAFASFNDDYFDDLGRSYSEFNNPLLSTAYDDAVRGIYDGFKSAGIMSSADLTSQMAGLDSQKAIEEQRLKDSALTYSTSQRDQVNKERQKLGEQLSGLAGGATDMASIDQQTSAIENFDVAGRVNKLKSPNTKTSMDFFSDFAKVPQVTTADPAATFAGTPSPASQAMFNQTNPYSSLGIQTPYQGSATKVIS